MSCVKAREVPAAHCRFKVRVWYGWVSGHCTLSQLIIDIPKLSRGARIVCPGAHVRFPMPFCESRELAVRSGVRHPLAGVSSEDFRGLTSLQGNSLWQNNKTLRMQFLRMIAHHYPGWTWRKHDSSRALVQWTTPL